MTEFINGPAVGQTLTLTRSPYFLRVVQDGAGKWDALDQLDDHPAADETIHVYHLTSEPMTAHVDGRDPVTGKRFGRWMQFAKYAIHPKQPDDKTARDNTRWREWAAKNVPPHKP